MLYVYGHCVGFSGCGGFSRFCCFGFSCLLWILLSFDFERWCFHSFAFLVAVGSLVCFVGLCLFSGF